ncbi:Zn(II)2Cys6 transcription factor domain-containing protein [Aspergillus stella-maris]|uniref:Zn(II)2Cys6 transcription factor domain-containing protein n=1 Tax=Aspergillus stella-maris TaxID=1810926 RepID=UPI003CCE3091
MPKVRTGCLTCKQRRVKCDEGRPSCWNCSRTGRRCEGYPTSQSPTGNNGQLQTRQARPIRVYNLPFKVPGSQADRQLLHFYCCETAGGLTSYSDPTLWSRLILQRSHHQPVIRSSLVTVAALYRDYVQNGNVVAKSARDAAMQRIARCHRQLRLHLRSPEASPDTALICTIFFFAFETMIGDCVSATRHLDNGLTLLKQCQAAQSEDDELFPHLANIFSRLDIHASTFDDERIPIMTLIKEEEMLGSVHAVPITLSSLDEAENVLTKIQNWLMHHIIEHVRYKHKPLDEFPQDLLRQRFVLYQQFERFFFAFDILLGSLPGDLSHRALLLRVQARMYYAILAENIPGSPFGPSAPNDGLRDTLADLQTFLSLDVSDATTQKFTLSSQLVAILYFLCLKTPDPESKKMAFELLQNPRLPAKDGLWEARKARYIIQTLMDQTVSHNAMGSLEEIGSDVFSPEDGGLEHVFRDSSTKHNGADPPNTSF